MNAIEIVDKHQLIHQELTRQYYNDQGIDKETFDRLHAENWEIMDQKLIEGGFILAPETVRYLDEEIDDLKANVKNIYESLGKSWKVLESLGYLQGK